jgi:hypothetical protein
MQILLLELELESKL